MSELKRTFVHGERVPWAVEFWRVVVRVLYGDFESDSGAKIKNGDFRFLLRGVQ